MPARKRPLASEKADEVSLVEAVGRLFQQVHGSAAVAQKCKKDLLSLHESNPAGTVRAVCVVTLLALKQTPQITSDALRRHYAFLGDVCRAFKEHFDSDELPLAVMKELLPFHNANEKLVRLAVTTSFEVLLKTVDQSNTSESRQEFYESAAEALKQRVHDRCPRVRERAAAAVAAFQTGKKTCDVTQQLIALLCTDSSADVRRQILRCIAPRKEFLEGYFHGMIRCTRDVTARVRAEAWDALGRFPWRYITAYASAKAIKLPELVAQGLQDSSSSVCIACRAALTNCWLHRDCHDECCAMLDGVACGYVLPSLAPFELVSAELLQHVQKRNPSLHFKLDLADIHTSALFMWKADCKVMCDREGEDETELLLPLETFAAVLQDSVYAYARPEAEPKTVKFRNVEDADNMVRILLSVFDIYDDNGYLAHADNTTRIALLRLLNFLLKVVPDDDPSLFVDVAVRSLRSLTRRTPEEATKTVTSALDSLFRTLKLPQRYALGYDDVEALGRKSRERQQELARRIALVCTGETSQSDVDELRAEMDRDEKFLLRMQLIALAFLSHSERGDSVPVFCSHIIQLGRQQDNERVKVAAIRSLGLQCLVSPDTVHTFMPLILSDAAEPVLSEDEVSTTLPAAAAGVVFDLVMEYGLKFFNVHAGETAEDADSDGLSAHAATTANADGAADTVATADDALRVRLQREQELAAEDVHKVGGRHLLGTLLSFLSPRTRGKHAVSIAGFCKLLSCNRIPNESVPFVMAALLCHYASCQQLRKEDAVHRYLHDYLNKFFRSYAASHPRRQAFVAKGGVAAFLLLVRRNTAAASRLMDYVTTVADAFTLTSIRDIDPEAAKRASGGSASGVEDAASDADTTANSSKRATTYSSVASRSNVARSSMQSGRLLRELSRHSLHEFIAEEILIDLASESLSDEQSRTCMDVLARRMYLYRKEPQPFLTFCVARALAATKRSGTVDEQLATSLQAWSESVESCHGTGSAPVPTVEESLSDEQLLATAEERRAEQSALLQRLHSEGFVEMDGIAPQPSPQGTTAARGKEDEEAASRARKRERTESIFLDIDAAVGSRRRLRL